MVRKVSKVQLQAAAKAALDVLASYPLFLTGYGDSDPNALVAGHPVFDAVESLRTQWPGREFSTDVVRAWKLLKRLSKKPGGVREQDLDDAAEKFRERLTAAAGGIGKRKRGRPPADDLKDRDEEIGIDAVQFGKSAKSLANAHGITERHARRIIKRQRDAEPG